MIDHEQAEAIARAWIAALPLSASMQLVLVPEHTRTRPYGWVFFYNSKQWLETRDFAYAIGGNGPIIVMQDTGEVISLGTSRPVEDSIAEFEDERGIVVEVEVRPVVPLWRTLLGTKPSDADIIAALRDARGTCPPHELALIVEQLRDAPLVPIEIMHFFKRAFMDVPLRALIEVSTWHHVGGTMTDAEFDALLAPYLSPAK